MGRCRKSAHMLSVPMMAYEDYIWARDRLDELSRKDASEGLTPDEEEEYSILKYDTEEYEESDEYRRDFYGEG